MRQKEAKIPLCLTIKVANKAKDSLTRCLHALSNDSKKGLCSFRIDITGSEAFPMALSSPSPTTAMADIMKEIISTTLKTV